MKWFRMYVEIIDDPKMKQVSDRSFRVFNYLLALAAEADEDGVIPMSRADIIWRLRISEKDLDTAVKQLSSLDIIEDSYPLKFLNWGKRQYKSDDVGVRVKRYRNKNVTLHETAPDTDTEQIQNRAEKKTLQGPVDNSDGNGSKPAFLENLKGTIERVNLKYPDHHIQRQVMMFVECNIRNHPDAIMHCLESLLKAPSEIKSPRAYLESAMKIENGKYNARDHDKRTQELKNAPINMGTLIKSIGKPING